MDNDKELDDEIDKLIKAFSCDCGVYNEFVKELLALIETKPKIEEK